MTSAMLNADTPALLEPRDRRPPARGPRPCARARPPRERGASSEEITAHTQALESARSRLTDLISGT